MEDKQESLLRRISNAHFVGGDLRVDDTFKMAFFNYHNLMGSSEDSHLSDPDNRDYVLATVSRKAAEICRESGSKTLDANAFYKATISFYSKSVPEPTWVCYPGDPKGCTGAAKIILASRRSETIEDILQSKE